MVVLGSRWCRFAEGQTIGWGGGDLSRFWTDAPTREAKRDLCEREFVYGLSPGGSHTMRFVCEDGHVKPVNCYGYSALKTAWASFKRKFSPREVEQLLRGEHPDPQLNEEMQYYKEDNGWSTCDGVAMSTISEDGKEFIRLYVSVSGLTPNKDGECAASGMIAAQDYLMRCSRKVEFDPIFQSQED